MQAGRDPDSQDTMGDDSPMQDQNTANAGNKSFATRIFEPTVLTRLQQKKRAAKEQPEELASADDQGAPAPQKARLIPQKKKSQKKAVTQNKANEQAHINEIAAQAPKALESPTHHQTQPTLRPQVEPEP